MKKFLLVPVACFMLGCGTVAISSLSAQAPAKGGIHKVFTVHFTQVVFAAKMQGSQSQINQWTAYAEKAGYDELRIDVNSGY